MSDTCSTPASSAKGSEDHIYVRRRQGRVYHSRQECCVTGKGANLLPQQSSDLLAYPAEKQGFLFSFPTFLLISLLISHSVICSAVCYSLQSRIVPTIANSSLLGDALALDSCLPKGRGITFLKTSCFAILKAASLSLSQKPIIQLSLSMLSPYANLMGSCLQSKCNCPMYPSMIVRMHMCDHAGGVCAYAGKQSQHEMIQVSNNRESLPVTYAV